MAECPICLDPLSTGNVLNLTCCHQNMHVQCYIDCMSVKRECPMCRAPQEVVITIRPRYSKFFNFVVLSCIISVALVSINYG